MGGIKLISIIASNKLNEQILSAIGHENVNFERYGEFEDIKEVLIEAANIYSDIMIIDLASSLDDAFLIGGLKSYRIKRPETRIIVIANGKVPGDPVMAQIVKMGIYDIITDLEHVEEALREIINNPATYKTAARWDIEVDINNGSKKTTQKVIEKEKIVEKIIIADQNTTVFWGYSGGMGTSTVAYYTAKGLAKASNKKVAVLDFEEITGNIGNIAGVDECDIENIVRLIDNGELTLPILLDNLKVKDNVYYFTGITIQNFFIFKDKHIAYMMQLLKREFPFIIVCAGNGIHTSSIFASFEEANKIIAVTNAGKGDLKCTVDMIRFWDKRGIEKDKFSILLNREHLMSEIDKQAAKELCENCNIKFAGSIGNKPKRIFDTTRKLFLI